MWHIRWMVRRDMPEVLEIEGDSFQFPWSEDDFVHCLRTKNVIGMVATDKSDERVFGYMIYELHKTRLHVLNFSVAYFARMRGCGRAMVQTLVLKLSQQRRKWLTLEVRESNTDAQMFFKACGFRCVGTMRNFYSDTNEDAYVFQYKHAAVTDDAPLDSIKERS